VLSITPTVEEGSTRLWMSGVRLDALTETQVVDQVIASASVHRGGWIATPNINFLRRVGSDRELGHLLDGATLRVADGVPLLWASRLARTPRLERITGSSLVFTLADAAARRGCSIYILGGREGAAVEAGARLQTLSPGLRVVGTEGPWVSADVTPEEVEPILQRLEAARPDIVFVGLGFPKQERFIAACRERLPSTWFLGCGAAINFAAGYERRAPHWVQRSGLEWAHRLRSEPRRLARRYLGDIPFALGVLAVSAASGLGRSVAIPIRPRPSNVVVLPEPKPVPASRETVIDLNRASVTADAV
jgi:N-acetylglucosaminyldiphosphoundecaprenol N-acetyl-beta-D-mannosaminyltransferase